MGLTLESYTQRMNMPIMQSFSTDSKTQHLHQTQLLQTREVQGVSATPGDVGAGNAEGYKGQKV